MVIHDTECPYWEQVSLNNTKNPNLLHKEYYMLHVFAMLKVLRIASVQVGSNVLLACPIVHFMFVVKTKTRVSILYSGGGLHCHVFLTQTYPKHWNYAQFKVPSRWPWTMFTGKKKEKKEKKTSNDIHLSPKHNQPPCTQTHLPLRVQVIGSPGKTKMPLNKRMQQRAALPNFIKNIQKMGTGTNPPPDVLKKMILFWISIILLTIRYNYEWALTKEVNSRHSYK